MLNADEKKTLLWLANGEEGTSSRTMAFWLMFGILPDDNAHPYDPADFNRCLVLLDEVPALRARLPEMAKLGPHWAAIVTHWDAIEAQFLAEAGLRWRKSNFARATYTLMKTVLGAVRDVDSEER